MTKPMEMKTVSCLFFAIILSCQGYQGHCQGSLDWLINTKNLDGKDAQGIHPRGLILPDEIQEIRSRAATEKFLEILDALKDEEMELGGKAKEAAIFDAREVSFLASRQAFLYLLTGETSWAEKSYANLEKVFKDTVVFDNPVSRGLTRAAMLQSIAIAYDFCYQAWTQEKRNLVNRQLYKIIYATHANMGFDANYSMVSNWMGVRWGSALFASMVWDNPDPEEKSILNPMIWDGMKRLRDHLEQNIYPEGWNAESIGYHIYNWSFIGPALIAYQNQGKSPPDALMQFAPQALFSLRAIAASAVNIPTQNGVKGMKPDLSDDSLNLGWGLFSTGLRLYPKDQLPNVKWVHDYLEEESLYSLLYYPEEIRKQTPGKDWLNFKDSNQGVVLFRNEFRNENDIIAVFNTSSNRVAGHKGPDVNTFRIIGLGVPFVIGAGRTNLVAGQTNLFPSEVDVRDKGNLNAEGKLIAHGFTGDGAGFALGKGSSTGVMDHTRKFTVSYDPSSGASAVFFVEDKSSNGTVWRLNTPEFNQIEVLEDGFEILAPNGASLKGTVLGNTQDLEIKTGKVKYGGETVRLNTGIAYQGENYAYNHWVDIKLEGNIKVLLTLQVPGKPHPIPELNTTMTELKIGKVRLPLMP